MATDYPNEDNSLNDQQEQEKKKLNRLPRGNKSHSNGDSKSRDEPKNPLDKFLDNPKKASSEDSSNNDLK
jgi:hypothetical protein